MSQLTDLIAPAPGQVAAQLLAQPGYWGGLNALFQSPDTLAPMCDALGDVPQAWRDYIVTPRQPLAVFGGGNG